MENYNINIDLEKYVFFTDELNPKDLYVMTKDEYLKYHEIIVPYDRDNKKVPDNFLINVIQLGKLNLKDSNKNDYGIINEVFNEFPVNRIRWEFISHK